MSLRRLNPALKSAWQINPWKLQSCWPIKGCQIQHGFFTKGFPNTAANFLLTLLKTTQITIGSVMHVIAAIAYPLNKIRLAQSLWRYYNHKVQFMASTDNLSMALDHDVHISWSAQNKICILEFSEKVISPNVLTLAAVCFSLAGFELQALSYQIFNSWCASLQGNVYMHSHYSQEYNFPYGRNCVNCHFCFQTLRQSAVWGGFNEALWLSVSVNACVFAARNH